MPPSLHSEWPWLGRVDRGTCEHPGQMEGGDWLHGAVCCRASVPGAAWNSGNGRNRSEDMHVRAGACSNRAVLGKNEGREGISCTRQGRQGRARVENSRSICRQGKRNAARITAEGLLAAKSVENGRRRSAASKPGNYSHFCVSSFSPNPLSVLFLPWMLEPLKPSFLPRPA